MKLLLVALAPSSTEIRSSAVACLEEVANSEFEGHELGSLRLSSSWDSCFGPLRKTLARENWESVVFLADKFVDAIAIERIAINETDVSIKDGQGRRPRVKTIAADGEPGYWSALPYRELSLRLSSEHLPTNSSHSAGKGIANYVFYQLMHTLALANSKVAAGLIHLPVSGLEFTPEVSKRFMNTVLETLGRDPVGSDRLGVDLDRIRSKGVL